MYNAVNNINKFGNSNKVIIIFNELYIVNIIKNMHEQQPIR